MIWIAILIFIGALVLLVIGSDKATDAAVQMAEKLKIHPLIIGIVILSIGTSIPEMTYSAFAMVSSNSSVAFGNIIGSDLVQITLILGIVALIRPLQGKRNEIIFYGVADILAIVLAYILVMKGSINWVDGIILCAAYGLFLFYVIRKDRQNKDNFVAKHKNPWSWYKVILWIVVGFAAVFFGSKLLVNSTVEIATSLGVPSYILAFIAVGLGTSLPELFVAATAAFKKDHALGIGTLLGSNITDPTLSLGFGALFTKGATVPPAALGHLIYLIAATLIVVGIFAWKRKISRLVAGLAIALYFVALIII